MVETWATLLALTIMIIPVVLCYLVVLNLILVERGFYDLVRATPHKVRGGYERSKSKAHRSYQGFIECIEKKRPLNQYQIGQLIFVAVISVVVFSIALSLNSAIHNESLFPRSENAPGFFDSSLSTGVNIVSFLFLVSIFLVQNANQDYSSELSRIVFSDKYLISIFLFVLLSSVFNLFGVYFRPQSPYAFMSLVFSVSSVCLVISLILFTGYFMQISNIIEYMESKIIDRISINEVYRENQYDTPLRNEDLIESLKRDTRLVSTTGITAIENSRPELVNTTIDTMKTIGVSFLQMTRKDDVNNTFMNDLNDQFKFLINTAKTENHEQKYLEQLARSLGEISRESIRTREINNVAYNWVSSLKDLFFHAIDLENNQAAGICIDEIGQTVLLTQENQSVGASQKYSTYRGQLKEVALACTTDHRLGSFFQVAITYYQWQFIMMLNQLSDGSRYYQEHELEYFFEEVQEIYDEAKSNYGGIPIVITNSLYGMNSFTTKVFYFGLLSVNRPTAARLTGMTSEPPEEIPIKNRGSFDLPNPQSQHQFTAFLNQYFQFHDNILQNGDSIDEDGYNVYPENLYLTILTYDFEYIDTNEVIASLTESWHSILKADIRNSKRNGRQAGKISMKAREVFFDYYLILFYLFVNDKNIMSNELKRLIDLHNYILSEHGKQESRWIYKYMKLFGAILEEYYDLRQDFPHYHQFLSDNFYQPDDPPGQALVPPLAKIGYPGTDVQNDYRISGNQIWRTDRDNINQTLLANVKPHAFILHENLNLEKNLPTALSHGQQLLSTLKGKE